VEGTQGGVGHGVTRTADLRPLPSFFAAFLPDCPLVSLSGVERQDTVIRFPTRHSIGLAHDWHMTGPGSRGYGVSVGMVFL